MKQEQFELLKQIRNILIIIAIILVVNVIVIGMNGGNRTYSTSSDGSSGSESTGSDSTDIEYDVSAFTEVTVDEMFTKVDTSGYQVVYIGRAGCGYCGLFLPALREAQTNFKYTTLYIDLDKVTSEGATKMQAISDEVSVDFGRTPMVIVYKDGVYQDMWLGYAEYASFETFLTGLGMTK